MEAAKQTHSLLKLIDPKLHKHITLADFELIRSEYALLDRFYGGDRPKLPYVIQDWDVQDETANNRRLDVRLQILQGLLGYPYKPMDVWEFWEEGSVLLTDSEKLCIEASAEYEFDRFCEECIEECSENGRDELWAILNSADKGKEYFWAGFKGLKPVDRLFWEGLMLCIYLWDDLVKQKLSVWDWDTVDYDREEYDGERR